MVSWFPAQNLIDQEIAAYQGSWMDQMSHRIPAAIFLQTFIFLMWHGWRAAGLMLISKSVSFEKITRPLAAVGRTALTNYLAQTIICTLIFYGHGLGLFARAERKEQVLFIIGIWLVQLIISTAWLRWFRFGPVEWIWRSLTYFKIQPFRN